MERQLTPQEKLSILQAFGQVRPVIDGGMVSSSLCTCCGACVATSFYDPSLSGKIVFMAGRHDVIPSQKFKQESLLIPDKELNLLMEWADE